MKLVSQNINGNVLNAVMSMNRQIKSCVLCHRDKSECFERFRGVRQEENVSPLLFALYLNDIEDFLIHNVCESVNILTNNINNAEHIIDKYLSLLVLLYADDTFILSGSKNGLQKARDVLFQYCLKWKLEVNDSKTKVIIFNLNRKNKT